MRNEKTKMRERKKSETSPNRVRRLASLVKGRGEDEARGKTHGAGHGATLRRRPHPFAHGETPGGTSKWKSVSSSV